MSEPKQVVGRLIVENWSGNGVGTPTEEVVRQATLEGVGEDDAEAAIESLRMAGDVYEIRPGLLVPTEEPEVVLG